MLAFTPGTIGGFVAGLSNDFRYALRGLWKSPGFTVTAILTLTLGIGAVTAVFSVVNSVLVQPYAFHEPGQLVVWRETIQELSDRFTVGPDNYRHYLYLKAHSKAVADAAIFRNATFAVGRDHPQVVGGLNISPNFFSVLGISPALGRSFLPGEDRKGSNSEVVITWSASQRFFGPDSDALGRLLQVGGEQKTVVGILPKTFVFPVMNEMPGGTHPAEISRYEIFEPLVPLDQDLTADDADFAFLVVARLKPGISVKAAGSELDGMQKAYSVTNHLSVHLGAVVEPLLQEVTGSISKALWLLFGAVMGVLLIGCVNLASLLLARSVARERDNAVRAALGAGPRELLQASLAESLVLSAFGGFAGVLLSFAGIRLFVAIAPANLPRLNEVHVSWPVLLFAAGISVLAALVFGGFPALRFLRTDPQPVLQSTSTRLLNARKATATRRLLVGFEVASTVVLLIFTSLVARSFSKILSQDRAFDSAGVFVVEADLLNPRYAQPDDTVSALARSAFVDRALDRLRSTPGVQFASLTSTMPLTGETNLYGIYRADHPLPEAEVPNANLRNIGPQYFHAMRIPLAVGEEFGEDQRDHPDHAIISQTAAKAAWPGENAMGRTFRINGRTYTVSGIAADARVADLKIDAPVVYLPYWHDPPSTVFFLIRTQQPLDVLAPTIRRELWDIDPQVAIPVVKPLDGQINESLSAERFQTIVLSSFGISALMIAVLGVYGVLAYSVSLRGQEFGVRVALGATKFTLVRLVLLGASAPVLAGLAVGAITAVGTTRWIRSLLYETSTSDPAAIAFSVGLLLLTAFVAALIPAYRAAHADPMRALRQE
jgi:predicted permease